MCLEIAHVGWNGMDVEYTEHTYGVIPGGLRRVVCALRSPDMVVRLGSRDLAHEPYSASCARATRREPRAFCLQFDVGLVSNLRLSVD
jgi:hypothetical protein